MQLVPEPVRPAEPPGTAYQRVDQRGVGVEPRGMHLPRHRGPVGCEGWGPTGWMVQPTTNKAADDEAGGAHERAASQRGRRVK